MLVTPQIQAFDVFVQGRLHTFISAVLYQTRIVMQHQHVIQDQHGF